MHSSLLLSLVVSFCFAATTLYSREYANLKEAPHLYWDKSPQDPFTKLYQSFDKPPIHADSEVDALKEFLRLFNIPESSQILVFSATSLQSGKIHPKNPRALYFNEHTYLGYVPGGRLEIISVDPELGAIFYILDLPTQSKLPVLDRSTRCMNCHSGDRMNFAPGLSIESVIPSMTGASLDGFRRGLFGHTVPHEDRLGGYYVTGDAGFKKHHGNIVGALSPRGLKLDYHAPGKLFSWNKYPVSTSDLLAHMVHEHQAGFVNLVVEGVYRTRYLMHERKGELRPEDQKILETHAQDIVDYVLFAKEAPLPSTGLKGLDSQFQKDFAADRKLSKSGASLKDFDLKGKLFRYRCSYMIYSELWQKMPYPLNELVSRQLHQALLGTNPRYAYLPASERQAILSILADTLPSLLTNPS